MTVEVDPRTIAGFVDIDDTICPEVIVYVVSGVEHQARCEQDTGHEPPCSAELHWVPAGGSGVISHVLRDAAT